MTTIRIRSYRDLEVWQRSIKLTTTIYRLITEFPKSELYGLTSQMRRAALSVASNIAEGHHRTGREFPHFLSIALGSLAELETQILITQNVGVLSNEEYKDLRPDLNSRGKMTRALYKSVRPIY